MPMVISDVKSQGRNFAGLRWSIFMQLLKNGRDRNILKRAQFKVWMFLLAKTEELLKIKNFFLQFFHLKTLLVMFIRTWRISNHFSV
jgi:hypothetical protein